MSGTLSGGEAQRIRLVLKSVQTYRECCISLDEPSIGLHQRDKQPLN